MKGIIRPMHLKPIKLWTPRCYFPLEASCTNGKRAFYVEAIILKPLGVF